MPLPWKPEGLSRCQAMSSAWGPGREAQVSHGAQVGPPQLQGPDSGRGDFVLTAGSEETPASSSTS